MMKNRQWERVTDIHKFNICSIDETKNGKNMKQPRENGALVVTSAFFEINNNHIIGRESNCG